MPQVTTVLTSSVPEVLDIIAIALKHNMDAKFARSADRATVAVYADFAPKYPAVTVVRPTLVMDRRELIRVLGIAPPADWEAPFVLTRILVPWRKRYIVYRDVGVDVAFTNHGIAVQDGKVLTPEDPEPWVLSADGKWEPTPQTEARWQKARALMYPT